MVLIFLFFFNVVDLVSFSIIDLVCIFCLFKMVINSIGKFLFNRFLVEILMEIM